MATSFPEVDIEHVRSNDLFVASHLVLLFDQVDQVVVDLGPRGSEEGATRSSLVEEEQVLLFGNHSMVILSQFLLDP